MLDLSVLDELWGSTVVGYAVLRNGPRPVRLHTWCNFPSIHLASTLPNGVLGVPALTSFLFKKKFKIESESERERENTGRTGREGQEVVGYAVLRTGAQACSIISPSSISLLLCQ